MAIRVDRFITSDNYCIEFHSDKVKVTDIFDRQVLDSVTIVSSLPLHKISEYLHQQKNNPFAAQLFLKQKVLWIGPYGLSGGMTRTQQLNTLTIHLNDRQTRSFTNNLRDHLAQLRLYLNETPEILQLVTHLGTYINDWETDLQPRLNHIATMLEEENRNIQTTLDHIRRNPGEALQKVKELIKRAQSLLQMLIKFKEDITKRRNNLLAAQAENHTLIDEFERKTRQLEAEIQRYQRQIDVEEAKVKDYNDNYGYQVKKNVAVGIGFGLIGLAIAEAFGSGPTACDQLRSTHNEAQERLPPLRRRRNETETRRDFYERARSHLLSINTEITALLQRVDRQRAALENGINDMQNYITALQRAEESGKNIPVRIGIANRNWDNAYDFFKQV